MAEPKMTYNLTYTDKFDIEDYDNRRLFLNSEIDESIITSIAYHILRYNRLDKGIPVEQRKPIILYINSPGGSVVDGYGLIDVILQSKTPVYTVNQALAASMGFLVFLAGEKRFSFKHGEFLMHDGSTFTWDSTAKAKDRLDFETRELEQSTKNYILNRTKIDEKLYDEKYRVEWYMLSHEARDYGICDYIIGEDCDLDEII